MRNLNHRMKNIKTLFVFISFLLLVFSSGVSAETQKAVEGAYAPLFKGVDFDDKQFDLSQDYKKRPIVVSFFSVRCVSCLTVVNALEKFKEREKVTDEIAFVYVSLDDWKKEAHIPAVWEKVFKHKPTRVNDGGRVIGKQYAVDTLPVTVVIDKSGKIIYRRDDYNMDFEKEITGMLKDKFLKQ